ncbi:MAG TPA: pirin family protein [Polyangiaceae bacterium]|nr:pirin family protein [Polyangiaceae bacterium]
MTVTATPVIETSALLSADPAREAASKAREIEEIYRAPGLHWVGDGFRVAGYFSAIPDAVRKLDPFLLLDYHPVYDYSPTSQRRGVGVHPHRGFETVTIAFQGSVAHHDSTGGGGVIGPGDVQWMTAASGILHKEYHEQSYSRRGGPFQMAQLWVNLPRAHKLAPPRYQPLTADQMGLATLANGSGTVRVIAGEFEGVRGPAKTFTPINLYDARLSAHGQVEFCFPARQTVALLVMKGSVAINGASEAGENDFVLFKNAGERISIVASSDAQLLVLNGEPLAEPVVQYGPFVMNTEQEIRDAFDDFSKGKFGQLED